MAHVHVLSDDVLFGSRLQADMTAAGHEVTLGPRPQPGAQAILADLTHDADGRLQTLAPVLAAPPPRPAILAFFAHVEPDVRERALAAGVDRVVPRSRMAREGPALLAALLSTAR
jgi:DNA-binding NarL/FixJ family response regulator